MGSNDPTAARTQTGTPPPDFTTTVLEGRYALDRIIGTGGMGIVYRARDLQYERVAGREQVVAIKILRAEFRARPDAAAALFEEVRRTRDLAHPNIVTAYTCEGKDGSEGEPLYMVMQYLEGKPLEALLANDFARGLRWDRARDIIEGIGKALAYAHDRGVIHCDLKPANVFVTLAGVPKVLDFGIAQAVRNTGKDAQALHGLTPSYASPEAIRAWYDGGGRDPLTGEIYRPQVSDDIYALGCVSYEVLTGARPFGELNAEEARQRNQKPKKIKTLSKAQNRALARSLAFDRNERTDNVEEFLRGMSASKSSIGRALAVALALLVIAGLAWRLYLRLPASENKAFTPPTDASQNAIPGVPAERLLSLLGLPQAGLDTQGRLPRDELQRRLQKDPRSIILGSSGEELDEALALCAGQSDCTPAAYADEGARSVTLSPFRMDSELVTVQGFQEFVDATHYRTDAERRGFAYEMHGDKLRRAESASWRKLPSGKSPESYWPVVEVDYADAVSYCSWRGERPPSEDEWEYAARGPERRTFPWGNDGKVFAKLSKEPGPIGAGPAEGIAGAYRDLGGVVWQWVASMRGQDRILKGGSRLESNVANNRAAARRTSPPDLADDVTGFRCASDAAQWPDAEYWLDRP